MRGCWQAPPTQAHAQAAKLAEKEAKAAKLAAKQAANAAAAAAGPKKAGAGEDKKAAADAKRVGAAGGLDVAAPGASCGGTEGWVQGHVLHLSQSEAISHLLQSMLHCLELTACPPTLHARCGAASGCRGAGAHGGRAEGHPQGLQEGCEQGGQQVLQPAAGGVHLVGVRARAHVRACGRG